MGILKLFIDVKFGVFMVYRYYKRLLKKFYKILVIEIKNVRIRVFNYEKFGFLICSYVKYYLNLVK